LRKAIRTAKRQFGAEELRRRSQPLTQKLLGNRHVKMAHTVFIYASLPDEVDTAPAISSFLDEGKRVLLPAVIGDGVMELREVCPGKVLQKGALGISEPVGEPFTDFDAIDVAVVPGLSFDARGARLGRGKGYYDRMLPNLRNAWKIGLCFDFQMVPLVPSTEHDVRMDEVIF
jgi:5-formyltetrahydrofolate cyclo-ligase